MGGNNNNHKHVENKGKMNDNGFLTHRTQQSTTLTMSNMDKALTNRHVHLRNVFLSTPVMVDKNSSVPYCRRNKSVHKKWDGCPPCGGSIPFHNSSHCKGVTPYMVENRELSRSDEKAPGSPPTTMMPKRRKSFAFGIFVHFLV